MVGSNGEGGGPARPPDRRAGTAHDADPDIVQVALDVLDEELAAWRASVRSHPALGPAGAGRLEER